MAKAPARTVKPLSPTEAMQHQQDENTIEDGQDVFLDVGNALMRIQENASYREHHVTFKDYLEARWPSIGRTRAYQIIDAVKTANAVSTNGGRGQPILTPQPKNERQLRELAKADDPAEVWEKTQETTGKEQPTAADIKKTVTKLVEVPAAPGNVHPTASIVLDSLNRAVPEHMTEQHDVAAAIMAAGSKCDSLRRELESLAGNAGGAFLPIADIKLALAGMKREITNSRYYTDCPACAGETASEHCKRCKGHGFIPHAMKGVLSSDEKEWLGI